VPAASASPPEVPFGPRSGPAAAPTFESLVQDYQPAVYRFLYRLCLGNGHDAEDLCQETFLRAFRAFAALPHDAHHRAWLYRIAYNLFLNGRRRPTSAELSEEVPAPTRDDDGRELVASIGEFVRTLPAKQRAALILRHVEGRDYCEIAGVLACSEDSARANVFQAVKKVRARFGEEYRNR
jgi:RNA polymerase sigma-70 factor, ECF subfamily